MTTEERVNNGNTNRLVYGLGAVAVLALLGVIFLGALLLRDRNGRNEISGDPTPTPFGNNASSALEPIAFGISGSDSLSVTLDAPLSLMVGGKAFEVRGERVSADGIWTPQFVSEDQAVWVYGSVVNHLIGLAESENNRAVLESLQPGDEMTLETSLGTTLTYAFETQQLVSTSNTDAFAQTHPGLTLFMLGSEGDERLVVNGRHIVTDTDSGIGNVIGLGETAQLESLQFTVPSVAYVPDRPEVPAGFAFFQVDFEVQNVGLTAFDTSLLEFSLVDSVGNRYALNPVASQVGNFPALSGFLNSGELVQASAGYQIPIGLSSNALSWVVTKRDSNTQLQVTIPFTGNAITGAQGTQIELNRAEVGPDLTTLILGGQITNLNTQPIVITQDDIELLGADGAEYLLLSTNPPLPWTISPGDNMLFNLIYQPPVTDTAVFTIFNQSFQLAGFQ